MIPFYDELSRLLTDYEHGEASTEDLYEFLVELHRKLAEKIN